MAGSLPSPEQRDVARALLAKAHGDEIVLTKLIEDVDVPDDILGFHAQQAVEKLLKAVLAASGVPFSRSHNLSYLVGLLNDAGLELPEAIVALEDLTPWAVEFRYDESSHALLDREATLQVVVATRVWATGQANRET